jgi:glycosyltransferase involved in cell wall biosynthesis
LQSSFDPGFGKKLSWDIDLLEGYDHQFLEPYRSRSTDSFWWLVLKPGLLRAILEALGARVLWVQGWQVAAYWQAVLEGRQPNREIWLRGETTIRSNAGGFGHGCKRLLLSGFFSRVDRFLYIGEGNRRFYLQRGVDEGKMASAPYCVDNDRFAAAAEAARPEHQCIRERWKIPSDAFCFLFAGKFIEKKRPLDLVQAAQVFRRANPHRKLHLLWVGTGHLGGALRRACHTVFDAEEGGSLKISANDDRPTASFAGFLNQTEISRAYIAADCLVLPSDSQETWGLVINEALASGLPCIVSDACGCAEDLVRRIVPDLCYPLGDISALARSMAAVMAKTPQGDLLRRHVASYNFTRTVDTVEALYAKALARAGST